MNNKALNRRFVPLYIATAAQDFVLWYAIEKLFMRSIGFNDAQIALAAIIVSSFMILLQVPSGIWADRWSRKGVLIIASFTMIASTLVGGLSHSIESYFICAALWGTFYGLYLGTYDSIVYDTLIEETGHSDDFEHYYGRLRIYQSLLLIGSALLSGIIGSTFGLRATYFLSIPVMLIGIVALIKFREPQLHKNGTKSALLKHSRETLKAVLKKGPVFWIVFSLILMQIGERTIFEFYQLWFLALALPVMFFGQGSALMMSSISVSGLAAKRIKTSIAKVGLLSILMIILSLALTRHITYLVIIAQASLLAIFMVLDILLNHKIHDLLPSKIRTGASSTIGTIAQIIFLPIAYLFGWLSKTYSIFQASYLVILIACLGFLGVYKVFIQMKSKDDNNLEFPIIDQLPR